MCPECKNVKMDVLKKRCDPIDGVLRCKKCNGEIKQEEMEHKTDVGLYLPQTVVEKEEVQGGRVVECGPGILLPETRDVDEPWKATENEPRYLPMQVRLGDFALFMKTAAMEIKFEGTQYLIVPHGSILLLVREDPTSILDEIEGFGNL